MARNKGKPPPVQIFTFVRPLGPEATDEPIGEMADLLFQVSLVSFRRAHLAHVTPNSWSAK